MESETGGDIRVSDPRNRFNRPRPSWQVDKFEDEPISKTLNRGGSVSAAELSILPESKYGASLKEAQHRSTYDFKQKLGNLKEALSTIKTQLSSMKDPKTRKQML